MTFAPIGRPNSPLRQRGKGGRSVIGRNVVPPGQRAKAQETPLLPGQVRCNICGNGAPPRTDGKGLQAHQAERYVSCAGGTPSIGKSSDDLCEHGNYPSQRRDCCGTTRQGARERPLPEHLRRFV